ncbi:hypothetical protein NJNGDCLN_00511 [Mannheimia haemolytica]
MKTIKIGLVGTGYIGRCHAIAYAQAPTLFPLKGKIQLEYLAEINQALADQKAREFGSVLLTIGENWLPIRMSMWWTFVHQIFCTKKLP